MNKEIEIDSSQFKLIKIVLIADILGVNENMGYQYCDCYCQL